MSYTKNNFFKKKKSYNIKVLYKYLIKSAAREEMNPRVLNYTR